jgi:hypothetical protein
VDIAASQLNTNVDMNFRLQVGRLQVDKWILRILRGNKAASYWQWNQFQKKKRASTNGYKCKKTNERQLEQVKWIPPSENR